MTPFCLRRASRAQPFPTGGNALLHRSYRPSPCGLRRIQAPSVKSGKACGALPQAIDRSVSAVTAIQAAMSYTSIGGALSARALSTKARSTRSVSYTHLDVYKRQGSHRVRKEAKVAG